MPCNCKKLSDDAKKYAKIKDLAARWCKSTGQTVVIYRIDGGYSFAERGQEAGTAVEYLYPT